MNSYIFSFKNIIFSLVIITISEFGLLYIFGKPDLFVSNIFERNFIKPDNTASFIIASKIEQSQYENYKYIQIGGSEGLHGVIPKYLNLNYYNASCCRNTGYYGYETIAYTILDNLNRNYGTQRRNIVLVLSPSSIPHTKDNLMENNLSKLLNENLISNKGILLNKIPSLSLRGILDLNKKNYEGIKLENKTMILNQHTAKELYDNLLINDGFINFPNIGIFNYLDKNHFSNIFNNFNLFENWLTKFSEKLKNYNTDLIVLFTPSPYEYGYNEKEIISQIIKKIENNFKEIEIIDDFIFDESFQFKNYWGDDLHLNYLGAKYFSEKLSIKLRQ